MHCIDLLLNSTYEHVIVISKRTSILYTNDYRIMSMIANIEASYDYLALIPAYLEMSVHDCCDFVNVIKCTWQYKFPKVFIIKYIYKECP
jgi:hypothetical protein